MAGRSRSPPRPNRGLGRPSQPRGGHNNRPAAPARTHPRAWTSPARTHPRRGPNRHRSTDCSPTRAYDALRDPWDIDEELLPLWRTGRDIIRDTARLPSPLHLSRDTPPELTLWRCATGIAWPQPWARSDGTKASRGYCEAAIALVAAANFWMPPGQVHGYLDSDPITSKDRANIWIPNVLLALGKPIILEPQHDVPLFDIEPLEIVTVTLLHCRTSAASATGYSAL